MMLEFKALRSSFERFIFYLLCIIHIIYLNKLFITVNFFKSWGTNFTRIKLQHIKISVNFTKTQIL